MAWLICILILLLFFNWLNYFLNEILKLDRSIILSIYGLIGILIYEGCAAFVNRWIIGG